MTVIKSIMEGFKFAVSLKRIIPYLIIDLVIFSLLIGFFSNIMNIALGRIGLLRFFASLGVYVIVFIILGLINLWINGAMIDQAKNPRKRRLMKSFEYSASRYLRMLATLILYTIIIFIVSTPPYIGGILAFLFGLVFFYIYPAIIIGGKGVIGAFEQSWYVFKKHPLETFVTWFLTVIISLIIIGIFLLPAFFYIVGNFIGAFQTLSKTYVNASISGGIVRTQIIPKLANVIYSPYFVPYFIIACIGLAFQTLFFVGTQARLYINLKKGKFSSEE